MKKSLLLLLFSIILTPSFSQTTAQGIWFLKEQQYDHAYQNFRDMIKADANNDTAWFYLGNCYFIDQRYDSAQICYEKSGSIESNFPYYYIGLGKVQLAKKNRAAALESFDRAKRLDKRNIEVYTLIVDGCLRPEIKDTLTARMYLEYANKENSSSPKYFIKSASQFFLELGDLEFLENNLGKAANAYESVIYYDKNNYEAYVRLGILYASARNFIEAHDAFNKAIKLNPSIIMAYKYLGDLCYGAGRYSEADSSYTNYFSKAEVSTDDEERYSLIMFFDKNYDKADSLMEQVIKKMPDNPVLFRIRGYIAYETGNYKNGLNYMNQFFRIQKNPDKIIASDYEYLGKLYLKNSMDSLGIINLEKSIALDSNKVYNYLEIANIYSKKENHIKAAEYYRKVKTSTPQEELNNSFRLGTECFYAGTQFKADYDTLKSSEAKQQNIPQEQILSLQQNYVKYLNQADSCFSIVASLSTKSHLGYLWKARAKSLLDPESMTDSAKNTYDKVLSLISPDDQTKYKKVIIECYRYFGSYYFFHSDREKKTDPAASRSDKKMAKDYFEKILSLDTNDQQAQIVLKALNQPE